MVSTIFGSECSELFNYASVYQKPTEATKHQPRNDSNKNDGTIPMIIVMMSTDEDDDDDDDVVDGLLQKIKGNWIHHDTDHGSTQSTHLS